MRSYNTKADHHQGRTGNVPETRASHTIASTTNEGTSDSTDPTMDPAKLAMHLVDLTTPKPTRPLPLKQGAYTSDHQNEEAKEHNM